MPYIFPSSIDSSAPPTNMARGLLPRVAGGAPVTDGYGASSFSLRARLGTPALSAHRATMMLRVSFLECVSLLIPSRQPLLKPIVFSRGREAS